MKNYKERAVNPPSMSFKGAILGDIAGSRWEFNRPKDLDWQHVDLFTPECFFTDDTVMTLACKWAVQNDSQYAFAYREFYRRYPGAGYGDMFERWARDPEALPNNSFGNGAAMRVSYVADAFAGGGVEAWKKLKKETDLSVICSHTHPEAIKGASTTTDLIHAGHTRNLYYDLNKEDLLGYAILAYPAKIYPYSPEKSLDELRRIYRWDATCQGTVPAAVRCFYESTDWESCIRNVLSLPCDTDTMGAIAGAIAEAWYGTTGFDDDALLRRYLDDWLFERSME